MNGKPLSGQFVRFVMVGAASNLVLFAGYLALTALGVGSKLAMTSLYVVGVLQTFIINKRWTFSFSGPRRGPFVRYCLSYLAGYLINLATLYFLADRYGWPHQLVQGLALVEVAIILFLLHRYWVFRVRPRPNAPSAR